MFCRKYSITSIFLCRQIIIKTAYSRRKILSLTLLLHMWAMISASLSMLLWHWYFIYAWRFVFYRTIALISSTLVGAKEKVISTRLSSRFSYLSLSAKLVARSFPKLKKYLLNSFAIWWGSVIQLPSTRNFFGKGFLLFLPRLLTTFHCSLLLLLLDNVVLKYSDFACLILDVSVLSNCMKVHM